MLEHKLSAEDQQLLKDLRDYLKDNSRYDIKVAIENHPALHKEIRGSVTVNVDGHTHWFKPEVRNKEVILAYIDGAMRGLYVGERKGRIKALRSQLEGLGCTIDGDGVVRFDP